MDSHEHHDDHDHDTLLPSINCMVSSADEKRKEIKKAFNESYELYE